MAEPQPLIGPPIGPMPEGAVRPVGPFPSREQAASPTPGTPRWEAEVRQRLYAGLWAYYHNDSATADEMGGSLDIFQKQDPAAYTKIYNEVDSQIQVEVGAKLTAEEVLAAAGAGGGGTRYIDVPTPEEFLDDFRTAFLGNVKTFTDTGTLNRAELDWAQNNWDVFANEYIGALAQKAQKGENVFNIVGVGGAEAPVGTEGAGAGQTESLVQRPNVALVHALTPTDWLNQVYPEKKLNLFIAGHMPSAQPKGGAGVAAYGAPRRVY